MRGRAGDGGAALTPGLVSVSGRRGLRAPSAAAGPDFSWPPRERPPHTLLPGCCELSASRAALCRCRRRARCASTSATCARSAVSCASRERIWGRW
jgi:hypothetical protein